MHGSVPKTNEGTLGNFPVGLLLNGSHRLDYDRTNIVLLCSALQKSLGYVCVLITDDFTGQKIIEFHMHCNRILKNYVQNVIKIYSFLLQGTTPYPTFKGKEIPALLQRGYRMPKPAHLSEQL